MFDVSGCGWFAWTSRFSWWQRKRSKYLKIISAFYSTCTVSLGASLSKVDSDFDKKDPALNIEPKASTMWVMRCSYQLSLQ